MKKRKSSQSLSGQVMAWILKSPLHGVLSASTLLIQYAGRKTGKVYTLPVNYLRQGDSLLIFSQQSRTWWHNLRGGCLVRLWLKGVEIIAEAEAFEDMPSVKQSLAAYLNQHPGLAKYFKVRLDEEGHPRADDIARSAAKRVIVRVNLANEKKNPA
jgi:hypothetical protein